MEWQPIETAPNDGTTVIVYDGLAVTPAEWSEENMSFVHATEFDIECIGDATHWMPLPNPPSE